MGRAPIRGDGTTQVMDRCRKARLRLAAWMGTKFQAANGDVGDPARSGSVSCVGAANDTWRGSQGPSVRAGGAGSFREGQRGRCWRRERGKGQCGPGGGGAVRCGAVRCRPAARWSPRPRNPDPGPRRSPAPRLAARPAPCGRRRAGQQRRRLLPGPPSLPAPRSRPGSRRPGARCRCAERVPSRAEPRPCGPPAPAEHRAGRARPAAPSAPAEPPPPPARPRRAQPSRAGRVRSGRRRRRRKDPGCLRSAGG